MTTTTTAPKQATFKIHSNGKVKAYVRKDAAGVDQYFIEGIASSNVRDRQGDTITAQAQAQMLEQAKGLTMFLNHSYDVPEDVLGTCEESSLETNGDIVDLTIRCKVAASNPRAMKSWQLIEQDEVTLGLSIGGGLTEYEVDNENDDGESWCPPLIINGINLFEISLCGVPANPRAYTRDFVSQISRGFMRSVARNPEVRELVRKALSKSDAPEPCAHKDGCTEMRAEGSLLCEAHANDVGAPDAGDLAGGDAAATPPPDSTSVDETTAHVDDHPAAPDSMTLSVPEGFDVDAFIKTWNDELAKGNAPTVVVGEQFVITLGVDTTEAQAKLAELTGELETKVSQRDTLVAEVATLTTQRDATKAECDTLLKTLAELKATPTGRQTKTATSGGSSDNATAILGVDPSTLTADELRALHQRIARGELATDGRELAQQ